MFEVIKRFSFSKFQFSKPEHIVFIYSYNQKFENPFLLGDFIVVGYQTKRLRSRHTGCTLSNELNGLYVRKVVNGKVSNWLHHIDFYRLEPEERQDFWTIFQSKTEYTSYDNIQYEVAKDVLNEYELHAPDSVTVYLNNNKHYWDMRYKYAVTKENRRMEAHNRILELQGEWYKDENLSAIFDVAMSASIKPEAVKEDVMTVIRGKELEVKKINAYLSTASKYEATWIEKEDRAKLEKEIRILYNSIK